MDYEQYLVDVSKLETPEEVSELLYNLSGVDVFQNSRKREIVEYRSLLCYILRYNLEMRWEKIAKFMKLNGKDFDHATAIHSVKMYEVYKINNKRLEILRKKFKHKTKEEFITESKLEELANRFKQLEAKYLKILDANKTLIVSKEFTVNEKEYRTLSRKQKLIYDERVSLILKSFKWKEYNTEFETINIAQ
jgi:hypothetical protein